MTSVPFTERSAVRGEAQHHAIPMRTLVEVELRKMVDTRAGRWLLISTAALVAIVLGVVLGVADRPSDRSFTTLVEVGQVPLLILMPVIGAIAATTEWSKRTVLSTFSLVPSRGRVLTARVVGALVLATAAAAIAFLLSAVAAVVAPLVGPTQSDWSLGLGGAGELLLYLWLSVLLGVALGTALLNGPLAIVLYFGLPTIFSGLTIAFKQEDLQNWLDPSTSWDHLAGEASMTGIWWARIATTALLWIALPLAIGTWRVLRREVD
jgi:ABC-2 type transport system permease protein